MSIERVSETTIKKDGMFIPMDPANRHYAAIVAAGETIPDWEPPPVLRLASPRDVRLAIGVTNQREIRRLSATDENLADIRDAIFTGVEIDLDGEEFQQSVAYLQAQDLSSPELDAMKDPA